VRHHIPDEVKEMALSMSLQGICDSEICKLTGVSECSVKRLRSTHRKIGAVSVKPVDSGRPRVLTAMEAQFLCGCIARQPDMSLAEL
ncbi:hypothetical protein BJV78DRAFT_1079660, partial [Lactifluus subvellereus]